jgi:Bacterial regulatory protein, Fis family
MPDEQALAEVRAALELTLGNVARAAHALGLSRRQLYRYLERLPGGWEMADEVRRRAMGDFLAARARLLGRAPGGVDSEPWTR